MKTKKVISVLLALMLTALCAVPALAADAETCEHEWGWIVDAEPTCGNGCKHMYCPKCGSTKDEGTVIPGSGEHQWEWVVDVPASDTVPGYKHQVCSVCGAVQNMNTKILATRNGADFGQAILDWIDVIGNFFLNIINQIRALFENARG